MSEEGGDRHVFIYTRAQGWVKGLVMRSMALIQEQIAGGDTREKTSTKARKKMVKQYLICTVVFAYC